MRENSRNGLQVWQAQSGGLGGELIFSLDSPKASTLQLEGSSGVFAEIYPRIWVLGKGRAFHLTSPRLIFCLAVIAILLPRFAGAGEPILLEAVSTIGIRSEMSGSSDMAHTLIKGDRFYISKKKYGPWRKLLIEKPNGKRLIGWAKINRLRGHVKRIIKEEAFLLPEKSHEVMPSEQSQLDSATSRGLYSDRSGLGLSFTNSFMTWGKRSFTTSDDVDWEIDDSSSNTFFVTVFADLKTGENFVIRPYVNLRETEFEGTSNSDFLNDRETNLRQSFQGIGILGKFYLESKKWWWGIALEGAQGQSLDISFDGDSVETRESDLSFYMIVAGSLGYDFSLAENVYFLPEVRAGAVANQDPYILFFETYLSFAYGL